MVIYAILKSCWNYVEQEHCRHYFNSKEVSNYQDNCQKLSKLANRVVTKSLITKRTSIYQENINLVVS